MTQNPNQLYCSDKAMTPHIMKIFQGEYLPPVPGFFEKCAVLDIGANVGGWSFWFLRTMANQNWCNPEFDVYEPSAHNFAELKINLGQEKNVRLHNVAVSKEAGTVQLFGGKNNCGECSLFKGSEQGEKTETVTAVAARTLPRADIVKIDTEGSEVDILDGYVKQAGNRPTWIFLEYHGENNRHGVDAILREADYILAHIKPERPGRGVAFYLLRDSYAKVYQANYVD